MKNKVLLVIIIVMLLIGGILYGANASSEVAAENIIAESIKSTEAYILESSISSWQKFNDEFMQASKVKEEMDKILLQLGLNKEGVERITDNDENINKEIVWAAKDNKTYELVIESIDNEGSGVTYIIADVYIDKDYKDLADIKSNLQLILKDKKEQIRCNSCITGTFEGKLNKTEMKNIIETALNSAGAKKIEGIEEEDLISISAYSDEIDNYIISNGNRVNMQIAIRYSGYDNKTYIWVGSPLIHIEY